MRILREKGKGQRENAGFTFLRAFAFLWYALFATLDGSSLTLLNILERFHAARVLLNTADMQKQGGGIDERVFQFACDVIGYVRTIKCEPGINKVIEQLLDAAGSVGTHREESHAGTPREFVRSNRIALKESRESHFWLRVCAETNLGDLNRCRPLLDEAGQIKRILRAIVVTAKADLKNKEEREKQNHKRNDKQNE